MRFGYMPSVNENLLCELEFAKESFDFVEMTYVPGAHGARIGRRALEAALSDFPAKGHMDWKCDLSAASPAHIENAFKQLEFFSSLGIREVTVHPSSSKKLFGSELIANNITAFTKLCAFCDKRNLSLHVENTTCFPFNKPPALNSLLEFFPRLKFTLDIGHALSDYSANYASFLYQCQKPPSHIHLHDALPGLDHLPFKGTKSIQRMLEIMGYAKKRNPRATVALGIFYELNKDGKRIPLEGKRRKTILLAHLKRLRKHLCSH